MTTVASTTENFFQKIEDWVVNLFKKEIPSIEQKIAQFGNVVTNEIKAIESNADVQKVLNALPALAEAIDPALVPMIQGLELEIPKILNFVTGVITDIDNEIVKPVEQQVVDALTKLKIIKASPSTGEAIYTGAMGTISTAVQHYVTTNNGILATTSQLLISSQGAHNVAA